MGVYLSSPKTDKVSESGSARGELRYGLTSMQGWRRNMEDSHMACADLPEPIELYGVFDGHGGCAVSAWVSQYFRESFLGNLEEVRKQLKANEISLNDTYPCALEETLKRPPIPPVSPADALKKDDDSVCMLRPEDGDDALIMEEDEDSINASALEEEVVVVCEALQRTFLTLDERMKAADARAELKKIHSQLDNPMDEEEHQEELKSMLRLYSSLVKVSEDSESREFSFAAPDQADLSGDDDEEDTAPIDSSRRIEEVYEGEEQSASTGDISLGEEHDRTVHSRPPLSVGVVSSTGSSQKVKKGEHPYTAAQEDSSSDSEEEQVVTAAQGPAEDEAQRQGTGEDGTSLEHISQLVPYEPENCGTTAVVAAVLSKPRPMIVAANAGDSRIVLCRGGEAIALSRDHKPNNSQETRRIRTAGGRVCQGRVDGNLNLSRSLGDLAYKSDLRIPPEAQKITAFPDLRLIPIHPDDEFAILACDGIWDVMGNQSLIDFVRQRLQKHSESNGSKKFDSNSKVLSQICEEVCDACIAENPVATEGVGCDNMTIMIVLLNEGSHDASRKPLLYSGRLYRGLPDVRAEVATSATATATSVTT